MKIFLDTSVLLAACGSTNGASREIFNLSSTNNWTLICTPYVIEETTRNLSNLNAGLAANWPILKHSLLVLDDVFTLDHPNIFGPAKDRPILFSALAWADVLLTLDRTDFGSLMGSEFYGLSILKPGLFLVRQRTAGRLV